MEEELSGISNGALLNRAADESKPYEFRLRAGRKAVREYANAGDSKKLESVYCDIRLPREVGVEAGLELVRYAEMRGQDLRLGYLKGSFMEEVSKAAAEALKRMYGGKRPIENPAMPARGKAATRA